MLVFIRGCGGSGKEKIAQQVAKQLRKKGKKVAVLSSDTFYCGITGMETDETIVIGALNKLKNYYLSNNFTVIIEGVLLNKKGDKSIIPQIIIGKNQKFYVKTSKEIAIKNSKEKFEKLGFPYSEKIELIWKQKSDNLLALKDRIIINENNNFESLARKVIRQL